MTSRSPDPRESDDAPRRRSRQRGQALVMFVAAIVFFIGFLAIVVDVTWYWVNELKVQRAADAAALAGAVWLPDTPATAVSDAIQAAKANGYAGGSSGCGTTSGSTVVTATVDPIRDVQINTCVSAAVPTFFMRLFGINSLQATRTAKAEFQLKLAMGSPINYLGAFGTVRSTGFIQQDTGPQFPTAVLGGAQDQWTSPTNAYADETPDPPKYAVGAATKTQTYSGFTNLGPPLGVPAAAHISGGGMINGGVQVFLQAHATGSNCSIGVNLSWNNGVTWTGGSPTKSTSSLSVTDQLYALGGTTGTTAGDTANWWGHKWQPSEFSNFDVRLIGIGAGCSVSVDYVQVQVDYEVANPPIKGPNSEDLADQGAWAAVNSQGTDVVNGDAYGSQPNSGVPGNLNSLYAPTSYYDYAVEMPKGATNGKVWIFDPGFCATDGGAGQGVGDRWFSGTDGVSTFFDVYDTKNTDWDYTDDTWVAGQTGPAGNNNPKYGLFRQLAASDTSLLGPANGGRTGIANCQRGNVPASQSASNGNYWHLRWWPLATGLTGPSGDAATKIYRIRVTSTDPYSNDQSTVQAENNFAIFATATGGLPYVHGLGSMMVQTPLSGNSSSDLYLAQVRAVYAGKTLAIDLYDPGDMYDQDARVMLPATLYILDPSGNNATFSYTATKWAGSGNAACNRNAGTDVNHVDTAVAGNSTGLFNGCWLQISIRLPSTYTAPNDGWWKIRYVVQGNSSNNGVDVTTWKASLGGSPVHLILPGP